LRLVTGDAWFQDLLDFLKSPFIFADADATRVAAAHELDEAFRRHGAPDGLAGHIDLARREGLHAAHGLLKRIERAGDGFSRGSRSLHEWTRRLLDSLEVLAAADALRADPVGAQLWALLERLAAESAAHAFRYRAADWRRWLFLHLEQSNFLDATVSSPLRLTHLAAAHHRDLEGAILLGVGAANLPGPARGGIFNDAARAQLGLPGAEERERQLRAALIDVMARTPRVALIWQTEQGGEPAPLSPWLVHLDAFHRAAWGASWVTSADVAPNPASPLDEAAADQASTPRAEAVPRRLSVSAWQSLVACPYQFFARHLLKLNDRDEVPEEMDKADYGSLVHRILARFHQTYPILAGHAGEDLAAALLAASRELFAEAETRGYLALAWRLRWERQIAAYVEWALEREAEGYRFVAAEAPLAREVVWGEAGASTLLHGRADRLDERAGATALLDYKTQSRDALKKKLAGDGEDVQLSAYAWLAGAREAGFVSVDADKVEVLAWRDDLPAAAEAEAGRLRKAMADLAAGTPLPARGAPTTCAWCEMRGLCRREHQDPPQA
jgi:ATP-dependent helicase/nuclease subunit B